MVFKSVLKSNHDLKKNGYQIIDKLHKMERQDGAERAYQVAVSDTYYFILGCRALFDFVKAEYPEADKFALKCDAFLAYLDNSAKNKSKLSSSHIGAFLRSYTAFFNQVIKEKRPFKFDQQFMELWNIKCLMPYVATWESNK